MHDQKNKKKRVRFNAGKELSKLQRKLNSIDPTVENALSSSLIDIITSQPTIKATINVRKATPRSLAKARKASSVQSHSREEEEEEEASLPDLLVVQNEDGDEYIPRTKDRGRRQRSPPLGRKRWEYMAKLQRVPKRKGCLIRKQPSRGILEESSGSEMGTSATGRRLAREKQEDEKRRSKERDRVRRSVKISANTMA